MNVFSAFYESFTKPLLFYEYINTKFQIYEPLYGKHAKNACF